jgi:hypothetical protein
VSAGKVTTVDRRASYYARLGPTIAADPLGFYVRAEKGRALYGFGRLALPDFQRELLLANAPAYDPGEPDPDQFDAPYAELSHGA